MLAIIGGRLRARRLEAGLTQTDLAARASVSPRFLVQLEKGQGNISVGRLADVCGALELPLSDLFRGLGNGQPEKVALVGLRGAGKSSVGRRLAEETGAVFVELDAHIEREAGMTLSEIFELRGESHYRMLERQVLERLLREPGKMVIAAGGSVVTAPETWRRLQEGSQTVWLRASPASHLARVRAQGDLRPMQGRPNAKAELEAILDERSGLYAQADVHIDTDGVGIDGVVHALSNDPSTATT